MKIQKKGILLIFCILMFFVFLCTAFGQKPHLKLGTSFINPAGGENWVPGSTVTIKWNPGSSSTEIAWTLILFKANPNQRIGVIRNRIPKNVTSHQWKAGETKDGTISKGSDFFIRLKFTRDGKNQHIDSKKFSIKYLQYKRARIIVTFPDEETILWNGRTIKIKWTTKFLNIKTTMHIALWDEKGETAVRYIGMGSNGSFLWKVPIDLIPEGVLSRKYKIRVKQFEQLSRGGKGQKDPIFGMSETFVIRFQEPVH